MTRSQRFVATNTWLGVTLFSILAQGGTWPVWRGSKERTAVAEGTFEDGSPSIAFRLPLGGEPSRGVLFPSDMPGKVLTSLGGRVRLIDATTSAPEWESVMLSDVTVTGSADLDGDNISEVVAFTRRQVYVLSSEDGSLLWQSVLGEHPTISAVRLADITGDGLAEVLIDDCGTCGVAGPLLGEVVSFASGQGTRLWAIRTTDTPQHYHQGTDAVLLGLGDGRPLVGLSTVDDYRFYDGATGQPLVIVPRGSYWFAQSAAMVVGNEQVLLLRSTGNAKGPLPPGVISIHVSPEEGQGSVTWEHTADPYATLDLSETSVVDLDGDGTKEVALNELSSSGQWSLVVLDLASGAELSRTVGWKLQGVVQGAHIDELPGLVVSGDAGLSVATYIDHDLRLLGEALRDWQVTSAPPADSLLVGPIRSTLPQSTVGGLPAVLVGQAPPEQADAASRFSSLAWATLDATGLHVRDAYVPVHPITAVYRADNTTRPYAQFAVGSTDGALTVLEQHLQPSNGSLYQTHTCPWEDPKANVYSGTLIGGRQPTRANLIGEQDGQPFVVVPNTADGTVVARADQASLVVAPQPLWNSVKLTKPSIFEEENGTIVAGVEAQSLVLRNATTGQLTAAVPLDQSSLGNQGSAFNEPLLLERDDGAPVIALDWMLPAVRVAQRGFTWDGESLGEAWQAEPMSWGGGFFSSAGRYQVGESTPRSDVLIFATNNTTMYRSVDTGQAFAQKVYTGHYTLPIIADLTGDGNNEVLFQSGFISPWVYGPNWAPLWQHGGPLPTYTMAGALIPCEEGFRYATPYLRSPRFLMFDATTGAVLKDAVAASGSLFATEQEALDAGALAGFLSNMSTLHTPDGKTVLLFGSSDGHLYAVDGCTDGGLLWALDAGTPLGEPSIGDWDGDGKEEVLVGASSGHVLGVDFGRLSAPEVSVTRTSHHGTSISWDPIEGAASYEYALIDPNGAPVWTPPYRTARGTRAHVGLTKALAGRPFRMAVRALGADGTAGSDGFSAPLAASDDRPPRARAGWDTRGRLWLAAADDSELDHYLLWGVNDSGERALIDDGFLSGKFGQKVIALDVSIIESQQSFLVTVVDAANNESPLTVDKPRRRGLRPHD